MRFLPNESVWTIWQCGDCCRPNAGEFVRSDDNELGPQLPYWSSQWETNRRSVASSSMSTSSWCGGARDSPCPYIAARTLPQGQAVVAAAVVVGTWWFFRRGGAGT